MTAAADNSRMDVPQEQSLRGDAPTQHIDRVELLRSDKPEGTQTASKPDSDGLGLKGNTSEGVLDFGKEDPFAAIGQSGKSLESDDLGDLTRGVKAGKKAATKDAGDGKEKAKSGDASSESPTDSPVKILSDTSKLDPNKPTVLFLDDFNRAPASLRSDPKDKSLVISQGAEIALNEVTTPQSPGLKKEEETGFTHGEFSARLAEANGFNSVRAQLGTSENKGFVDFSKSINSIADQVDAGKLKLGKGDVVNISLGGNDPTFEQVNGILGSNKDNQITPQNISNPETQKDILDRLSKLSEDPSQKQIVRDFSKIIVDTNKAVQRLQDKGIEVLHAASNDGKDTVSLEFLKANRELASVDPKTNKPDSFAAEHARITPGNGVYPIRFQPGTEMGGGREGKYTVEGTGVKFRGEEFGNLNMQQTVSIIGEKARTDQAVRETFATKIGREEPPRSNENGYLVAVAAGNSFVNIDYLAKNRERLQELKRGAN
ncbi:MAG: hypothetical protein QG625_2079 [Cyanobacteriota bacterium erpe_2018_sw_39hr_WHONDRS-SW48-000098_B_bin.30]|jgi:hypothetical protein|nr:hypothetical protein [Cyanobacteriota bacterium erpe_2018_sw_39hr_WHONDRS-SW48-000098_B_bin.30]